MVVPPVLSWMIDMPLVIWMATGALPTPVMLKLIVFEPFCQFDSVIAARSVQRPCESAQTPSPLLASLVSAVLLTTKGGLTTRLAAGAPDALLLLLLLFMSRAV